MVCPNCSSAVPDDEMFCKNCGAALKKSKKKEFVINIPDEEVQLEPKQEETFDEVQSEPQESIPDQDTILHTDEDEQSEEHLVSDTDEMKKIDDDPMLHTDGIEFSEQDIVGMTADAETEVPVQESQPKRQTAKTKKKDPRKKTYTAIKLIASFCAIVIVLLTGLSAFTDIFEDNPNKTVVFSGLSSEQKSSFEEYAQKLTPLFEKGYNSKTTVFDSVLDLMAPSSENGLYAGFFEKKSPITQESDPVGRFKTSDDGYSYCKVSEKDIEEIAKRLSLEVYHDINNANCYYYDGNYYFASDESNSPASEIKLTVEDAKQTQSGDYYIICNVDCVTAKPDAKQYFLVSLENTAGNTKWNVVEVSDEPIIESQIVTIKDKDKNDSQTAENVKALDFEMKRETVTIKTSSGEIYAEYIVEYPYFASTGITQTAINNIYSELVDSYKSQAENADKLYEKYIKDGYDKADLPLYTHIVSSVAYNDFGYISLLERTTQSTTEKSDGEAAGNTAVSSNETTSQAEEKSISLFKSSYEGYTYVIESGDFVKKDEVLGKDYQQTYKKLYEIYCGIENESEPISATDTQGIGEAVYSSAWVLSNDGVLFCYKNQYDALDKVVLPYEQIENMTIKLK